MFVNNMITKLLQHQKTPNSFLCHIVPPSGHTVILQLLGTTSGKNTVQFSTLTRLFLQCGTVTVDFIALWGGEQMT